VVLSTEVIATPTTAAAAAATPNAVVDARVHAGPGQGPHQCIEPPHPYP
jgi:hypothetical protein